VTVLDPETGAREAIFGPASAGDVGALVSIASESPRPWTARAFAEELERDSPSLFTLRSSGRVVGFVVARTLAPELDIVDLAVARAFRRRGLGRHLLRSLLDRAARGGVEKVFLEVREGNRAARRLYRGFGFEETQRRREFYQGPVEDAILMRLEMSRGSGLKGPRNAC
jgi:ribosomal-protein-alanine N-acetyltransferase